MFKRLVPAVFSFVLDSGPLLAILNVEGVLLHSRGRGSFAREAPCLAPQNKKSEQSPAPINLGYVPKMEIKESKIAIVRAPLGGFNCYHKIPS